GSVVIPASTRRLTGGHFECRDLGAVEVKGWAEPIVAWEVLRTSGVESRFEAQHDSKLTPLFGRDEEIDLLLRRWRFATQGEGRVVVLRETRGSARRTLGARRKSGYKLRRPQPFATFSQRPPPTQPCATFAQRTTPTVRYSHSSANSNGLPGSSAATRAMRSSPSSKRCSCNRPLTAISQ